MSNVLAIKQAMASYLGRESINDLNPINMPTPGIGIDLGLLALNNARRAAEKAHDFKYAETDTTLSIASTGSLITGAAVGIKRVKYVSLPIASGEYEPIEFLTSDQFTSRVRMQAGRQQFNEGKTLTMLGASGMVNPLAYQNGQTLYLSPSTLSFPIVAKLSVVRWMADYALDADTDFFTLYAPEFLQWQGIVELNNLYRRYAPKEGSIDVKEITGLSNDSMKNLLEWDMSTIRGTSAPEGGWQTPQPEIANG